MQIGEESNFTEEFQLLSVSDISDVVNFSATCLNTKARPLTVRLSWDLDPSRTIPDYWIIERKVDTNNEDFVTLGRSYIQNQFLDYNVTPGYSYVYRIRAFDTLGRVSSISEARIVV